MVISEQIDSEMTISNCFSLLQIILLFANLIRPLPDSPLSLLALMSLLDLRSFLLKIKQMENFHLV